MTTTAQRQETPMAADYPISKYRDYRPLELADGYTGRRTASIVGVTYRQLDYWARTNVARPSLRDATGSGSVRRYSRDDLITLSVIKALLDAGMTLERVRSVMANAATAGSIANTNFLLVGFTGKVWFVTTGGEVMAALVSAGTEPVTVLNVGGIVVDLDRRLEDLRTPAGAS